MSNAKTFLYKGRELRNEGKPMPVMTGSWQSQNLRDGWIERDREIAEEATAAPATEPNPLEADDVGGGMLKPFPAAMPAACREHVTIIACRALATRDSTLALRLDRKITKLYGRYERRA